MRVLFPLVKRKEKKKRGRKYKYKGKKESIEIAQKIIFHAYLPKTGGIGEGGIKSSLFFAGQSVFPRTMRNVQSSNPGKNLREGGPLRSLFFNPHKWPRGGKRGNGGKPRNYPLRLKKEGEVENLY